MQAGGRPGSFVAHCGADVCIHTRPRSILQAPRCAYHALPALTTALQVRVHLAIVVSSFFLFVMALHAALASVFLNAVIGSFVLSVVNVLYLLQLVLG